MDTRELLTEDELPAPYSWLTGILSLYEIFALEEELSGEQIEFKKSIKNIAQEYPELCKAIGEVKAAKVIESLSYKGWIYFPRLNRSSEARSKIKGEFNGYNYRELAKKYGYSVRQIRRIVSGKKKASASDERQLSLFESL